MRNLKKSEEIILLILTAALIGLFYFQFVYKGVIEARSQYDTSLLETQLTIHEEHGAGNRIREKCGNRNGCDLQQPEAGDHCA